MWGKKVGFEERFGGPKLVSKRASGMVNISDIPGYESRKKNASRKGQNCGEFCV